MEPDDDHAPEWYRRLERDLQRSLRRDVGFGDRRWAKSARLWDLVNTSRTYPNTVPVLLDWLEHLDERITHPHLRWGGVARRGLNRSLIVDEARNTRAVDLMLEQFDRDPPFDDETLFTAALATRKLAGPEHFDRVAAVVEARPPGRSPLIEWLGSSRRKQAIALLVAQLDDPEVATWAMIALRHKTIPAELRSEFRQHLERYMAYPGDPDRLPGELRRQAQRTFAAQFPDP